MSFSPKIVAVIPARGGSKGIPRKNLLPLAGKPLLAHSILQAKLTPGITRVVVSTDDAEIAAVSREWGAEVVPRPTELSGDKASSESALLHVLDYLKNKESYEPDLVVFLQATSPCRQPGEIQAALDTLRRENADSLFSACRVEGFAWRLRAGAVTPVNYDPVKRPMRQDLQEEIWEENGSFYIFKPSVLRKFNSRLGGRIAIYRMSALNSFQIDEPGDVELLELLLSYRQSGKGKAANGKSEERGVLRAPPLALGAAPSPLGALHLALGQLKLLVLDFDGVLTDNRVLVSEDGRESVLCHRGDSLGLGLLKAAGIEVVVLSKEKNPVVAARCRKLGIEYIQGCDDKLTVLKQKAESGKLKPEEIAYVGNDVNDVECLKWVGLPIAVADSVPQVKAAAKWITAKPGGHGAVREVCDLLLNNSTGVKKGESNK